MRKFSTIYKFLEQKISKTNNTCGNVCNDGNGEVDPLFA